MFWEFVCSRERPFQLEDSEETSRTSGLALQGRVAFQHVEMGRASSRQSRLPEHKLGSGKM